MGGGYLADVTLLFDNSLHVKINGRELLDVPYYADKNAYEEGEQVVLTDGFFCRAGRITSLQYEPGFPHDHQLYADMVKPDGTVEKVVFHTGSEESLYLEP